VLPRCPAAPQSRLWPSNCDEAKAAFVSGGCAVNPWFEYSYPVASHELGRFAVHTEYLPLAERVLDAVMATYGSEKAYRASLETGGEKPMTPDELVKSAEEWLRDCKGPYGSKLLRRLNIHFKKKKPNAHASISVRGATLNVPLPNTMTKTRAKAVWAHELGTHFLRGVVNEPTRKNVLAQCGEHGRLTAGNLVPIGGTAGWEEHRLRQVSRKRSLWTNPKLSRRSCTTVSTGYNSVEGNRRVAKRPRERSPTRNPLQFDSQLLHRCTAGRGSLI
jgi:hypothetical protein